MMVCDALRRGAEQLEACGVPQPTWDAEMLMRHVLSWDRATLITRAGATLAPDHEQRFFRLLAARARRHPLQHLTGTQAFWRLEFSVTPDVLIPRPETEILIETALDEMWDWHSPTLVDVGTGSGCIALSLAAERADAAVHAIDISRPALVVAARNARRLGLESRVHLHEGDLLEPVAHLCGRADLVACNPPYVDRSETLPPEVREHEPAVALFPPGDRYSIYRRLAPEAGRLLRPGGVLLFEVGLGMEAAVAGLCASAGLEVTRIVPDLQRIPRIVVAHRPK